MTFGEYVKELRIKKRITLREFCRLNNLDPSNWSKVERGILSPPKSKNVLTAIANSFHLEEGSEEWNTLFDLAAIGHIPRQILTDENIVNKLPIFFRTIRGEKPTERELKELIKLISETVE